MRTIPRTDAAGFLAVAFYLMRSRLTALEWFIQKQVARENIEALYPDLFDLLPPDVRNA